MMINADRFKRVARSLRAFSRWRLLTSFHLAPPASEKFAIPAPGHDKLQETSVSDSLPDNDFSSSYATRDEHNDEHITSAMAGPTLRSTNATDPTHLLSIHGNRSVCRVCRNFDTRAHGNSKETRNETERDRLGETAATDKNGEAGRASTLPLLLLWEAEPQNGHNKPSRSGPNRTPLGHYPPSWSPASVSCPQDYSFEGARQSTTVSSSETLCRVLDVSCELAAPTSSRDNDRSTLTIQGLMCELECRMDPSSNHIELVQHDPVHSLKTDDDVVTWSITMTHDILPPGSIAKEWGDVKEKLSFLPILRRRGRESGEDELVVKGLALRRVAGTSDVCTRIGTIKLRFWTSGRGRDSWKDYLGRVATGGGEKIVTII
jgi:hypothetical protein